MMMMMAEKCETEGEDLICRLCKQQTVSFDHLVSGCPILTPIEYKGMMK